MSVNTPAMIQAPPSQAKSADGKMAERGQKSSGETVAGFQSVIEGMKDRGQRGSNARDMSGFPGERSGASDGGTVEGTSPVASDGKQDKAGIPGERVSFSTSNLADALRQASQNVLSQKDTEQRSLEPETPATDLPGPKETSDGAVASTGLGVGALIAAGKGERASIIDLNALSRPIGDAAGKPGDNARPTGRTDATETAKTGTSSLFAQFGVEPEKAPESLTGKGVLPEEASGTVKVLRQETHFAPNMRLSPAQQVGDQIANLLEDIPRDSGRLHPGLNAKAEGPVLKTLDIQLTPHELGTVKVSLRMVGDDVEVTLLTSKAQTAELLKQDRQLLDQMLRATGFKAETIAVQAADDRLSVQAGNTSTGSSTSGQPGANGDTNGNGQAQNFNDGNSDHRNERADRHGEDPVYSDENLKGTSDEERPGPDLSEGIYL
ncbi:flagellar hook-length control protein FliK [Roseibium sp. SCP14]|uniref:flagellar hook-length control protein FliK n=1 Tax=Roseibium sp. SCP14 TaxID=3141375 RepID=UPI003335BE84